MEIPHIPEKWQGLTLELTDEYLENKRNKKENLKTKKPLIMKKPVKKIKVTMHDVSTQTDHYCCIEEKKKCTIL